jgi:hypothetical protein
VTEALQLREELIELLRREGFALQKWCANEEKLPDGIPAEKREKMGLTEAIKTLIWDHMATKTRLICCDN